MRRLPGIRAEWCEKHMPCLCLVQRQPAGDCATNALKGKIMLKYTLGALLALTTTAMADTAAPADNMAGMAMDASPATTEYTAVMNTMMTDMMIPYSGNADRDFIMGMIPHHQGAVDNARIVLKYGKDPDVRKFAESVIAAQEAEIKWMNDWLAAHPE
jgi:uncharacterized protein (DUF305 family)